MHVQLAEYLSKHRDGLENLYTWNFDVTIPTDRFKFQFEGSNAFQRTLELKRQLSQAATAVNEVGDQMPFADYFVREWGGIRRLSRPRLEEIVLGCSEVGGTHRPEKLDFRFDNVSSWSKWLSIVCSSWALIYDARVAYSLNAINFITKAGEKVFPAPQGRNTTMNLLDAATLALAQSLRGSSLTDKKSLSRYCWRKEETYPAYLDLVSSAHIRVWPEGTPLVHTEMLLFAIADTVIFKDLVQSLSSAGAS